MDLSQDELNEAKQMIQDYGLKVSAIGSPIGKVRLDEPFEPHLDKFKHAVELAQFFETPYIRMFSYYAPEGKNTDDCWGQVMERMPTKLRMFEDLWCDGKPEGIRKHVAQKAIDVGRATKKLGVQVVNGFIENPISHLRYTFAPIVRDIIEEGCTYLGKIGNWILDLSDKWAPQVAVDLCPIHLAMPISQNIFRPPYVFEAHEISKHPEVLKAGEILKSPEILPPQRASKLKPRSKIFEFRRYKKVYKHVEKEAYYSLKLPSFLANWFKKLADFLNLLCAKVFHKALVK